MHKQKINKKMSEYEDGYLTAKEVVDYYFITGGKLRDMVNSGMLKSYPMGRFIKYKESDIIRIRNNEQKKKYSRKSSQYSLRYTRIFNN